MEKSFSFSGQREGEKVVSVVKNHPFVFLFPGLKSVLFLVVGIAVYLFWPSQYSGMVLFITILIGLGIFFRTYFDYSQSVFVITNQRIINVDQDGFWKRKITETEIDKIQDAASETSGMLRTMFKFGDLVIRTAGVSQGSEIRVKNIANPYQVQQKIVSIK
ncbi:MAG: PH domain-containing protein [Patescibacteria group bacterium]